MSSYVCVDTHSNIFSAHRLQLKKFYEQQLKVKDKLGELTNLDSDLALRLIIDNENSLSPSEVLSKLSQRPKLQVQQFLKK